MYYHVACGPNASENSHPALKLAVQFAGVLDDAAEEDSAVTNAAKYNTPDSSNVSMLPTRPRNSPTKVQLFIEHWP